MRRLIPTLLLVTSAAVVGWLSSWQWREGSFDALFGAPPVAVGDSLYPSFDPSAVRHITVNTHGASAKFLLQENGWHATAPWQDRERSQFNINGGRDTWVCNDCSDPACEHKLFTRLLTQRTI